MSQSHPESEPTSLSLASVVYIPADMAPWKKVDGALIEAEFHRKYWGTSIEDENDRPKRQELILQPEKRDEDMNQTEGMDVDSDELAEQDESTAGTGTEGQNPRMDADDENPVGDDDDDSDGCYVLDIDIEGMEFKQILVRKEYRRIYDYFAAYYNDIGKLRGAKAPGAVLTGNPGIGKSVFILYALRRCLSERKPVIWFSKGTYFLFVDDGVYKMPQDFQQAKFHSIVWTFVDADHDRAGIPPHLIKHGTPLFVIYVTSPAKERWDRMYHTVHDTVVVMNPWTRKEIHQAAPLIMSNPDMELIDAVYDQLGPIPRLCFEKVRTREELELRRDRVSNMLGEISLPHYQKLVQDGGNNLTLDGISNKMCLIRRESIDIKHADRDTISQLVRITPITDSVRSSLAHHFRNLDCGEQIRLYKLFAGRPSTRGMTSNLFEGYCQQRFQSKISIVFLPMVRLPDPEQKGEKGEQKGKAVQELDNANRTRRPQWHSCHSVLSDDELEQKRLAAIRQLQSLHIRPRSAREFRERSFEIQSDVLYVPSKDNQVALDSFILHRGIIYIFQFASDKTHDIKEGLISFLTQLSGCPPRSDWRLIFVVPDESEVLKCPVPKGSEFVEIRLFSSMVALEDERRGFVSIAQRLMDWLWFGE